MTARMLAPCKSVGLLMLAGFLAPTGHSQTLPEQLTADNVMDFITANNIDSVADLIESLPPLHKRHVTLVLESQALNRELVSRTHPRVISFGADARFILSWATNPDAPENVEFLQPMAEGWDAGVIDFSGDAPELSRPEVCSSCHGHSERPIWGDYNEWRGTIDDKKLESQERSQILSDLEASNNPRFSPLELTDRFFPRTVSTATGKRSSMWNLGAEFGSMLALRQAQILFNRLKKRDDYAELAEQALCGDFNRITRLFPLADHYLAAMHKDGRLIVVQEDSDDIAQIHDQKFFSSGNASVENSLKFLVLHDFWSRDKRVFDFYARLGNEQVSPRFTTYLNYLPDTATAEQEMRASYDQHFVLEGQASLNARIDKETRSSITKTAVFHEGHFVFMAPRVCNIVRQAPGQRLSQLRIADGKAAEGAGEITFAVTLGPARARPVNVDWFTYAIDGRPWYFVGNAAAEEGMDYVSGGGLLTFHTGETRKNLTVKIKDDDVAEPPEFFQVHLQDASENALIVDGLALATIEGELPRVRAEGPRARFENAPLTHDGLQAFTVQLQFSEEVELDAAALTDGLLTITGGTAGQASLVTEGSNIAWEIPVTPGGDGDVVLTLPAPKDGDCDEQSTICTADGRRLLQATTVTVRGPPVAPPTSAAPPAPVTPPVTEGTGDDDEPVTPPVTADTGDDSADTGDGTVEAVTEAPPAYAAWGERLPDRDIQLPPGSSPSGLWSDGTTLWVISDAGAKEVTTYLLSDGAPADHRFHLQGGGFPAGLWSDGETLWAANVQTGSVLGYRLSDGARQPGEDIPAGVLSAAGNLAPAGLWSDGTTLWVMDILADKAFAYRLSDKVRVEDKELDLRSADGPAPLYPWGLWSDGETALVTLYYSGGVEAFALSGGGRQADRALSAAATGAYPMDLWSDGETLWVVSQGDPQIRAFAVPGLRSAAAQEPSGAGDPFDVRVVTRVDADSGAIDGGQPVYIADAALRRAIAGALGQGPDAPVGVNAMASIRSLNARGAGIGELTGLEYAVNLQALDLGRNPVRDPWTLGLLPRLTVLNLDGAASDLVSLAGLIHLERLSLRNNGLTDISALAGLVNLRHLSLRGNALSDAWPLAGLAQLEILDLRGNSLRSRAPLSGLYNLRHLDPGDNRAEVDTPAP